jgi:hypothetical protein
MSQEWMTKDILKKCCNTNLEEREDLEDLETTFRRYSTRGRNRLLRSKFVKSYDDDDNLIFWSKIFTNFCAQNMSRTHLLSTLILIISSVATPFFPFTYPVQIINASSRSSGFAP